MRPVVKPGRVSLVGAGPGDPELITLRGLHALERADVVLYDRLVAKEILRHARADAELISVGKRCGSHSKSQEEINRLLVDLASSGKHVVRLKNGDPFVFGRGGEEVDVLAAAGIPFEVVPGVTAALGAGAYCGLPLTLRGVSSSVTFVTGHEDPTKGRSDVDWALLARTGSTLVVYMAMAHQEEVVSRLIASGLPANTPAAVVCWATLPEQICLTAPLEQIPELVRARGLTPPSLMIIGHVVDYERTAAWFEALPLFGSSIVVSSDPGNALGNGLRSLGARILALPQVAADRKRFDATSRREEVICGYTTGEAVAALTAQRANLVAFTSPEGSRALSKLLPPKDLPLACRVPAAALGPHTARVVRELGFSVVAGAESRSVRAFVQDIQEYLTREKPSTAAARGV